VSVLLQHNSIESPGISHKIERIEEIEEDTEILVRHGMHAKVREDQHD
jgi:hypothetical protein